jgi:CRP-like cAMP-binding protein
VAALDVRSASLLVAGHLKRAQVSDELFDVSTSRSTGLVLLVQGAVREVMSEPEGGELLVDVVCAPAILAMDAVAANPSVRQFRAIGPVEWAAVAMERLKALSQTNPEVMLRLLEVSAQQLERRQHLAYSIAFEPVKVRLARLIERYALLFGVRCERGIRIELPLSYERLSRDLGVTTRSIDRNLAGWLREGWISRHERWFVVERMDLIGAEAGCAVASH